MKYAMIAMVLAFLFAVQTAFAAKPAQALPTGVKAPKAAVKTFAPPKQTEIAPKAAVPVQVESAYEEGSESQALAQEPEAHAPAVPAGNAMPASAAPAVKRAPKAVWIEPKTVPAAQPAPQAEARVLHIPVPAGMSAGGAVKNKKQEIEIEVDEDGEIEIEAESEGKIEIRPVPAKKAANKISDDDYVFSDDELGISQYMKPAAPAEKAAPKARAQLEEAPFVELPEPMDGYSPEYEEGKLDGGEESPADALDTLFAANKPQPGTLEFEMAAVDALADSVEPDAEKGIAEVAKRR